MISTTQEYKNEMSKLTRNPSYMNVSFGVFNLDAQENNTITYNDNLNFGDLKNLVSLKYVYDTQYITFDKDFWKLDGTKRLFDENNDYQKLESLVSNYHSSSDDYAIANTTLIFTFDTLQDILGLTIEFDTIMNRYPTDFIIMFFDENGVGLGTEIVTGNNTSTFRYTSAIEGVKSIKIFPSKMNEYSSRLRISSIKFGLGFAYTNNELISSERKFVINPATTELSTRTFSFTIDNENNVYDVDNPNSPMNFLQENQKINVQYGIECDPKTIGYIDYDGTLVILDNANPAISETTLSLTGVTITNECMVISNPKATIEWIDGGKYNLSSWSAENSSKTASFTGIDRLGTLTKEYVDTSSRAFGTEITLKALAEDILTYAGLTADEYTIPDEFANYVTVGIIPENTDCKSAFQLVANAAGARIMITKNDLITLAQTIDGVNSYASNGTMNFTYDDVFENIDAEMLPKCKQLIINKYGVNENGEEVITKNITDYGISFGEIVEIDNPLITSDELVELVKNNVKPYVDSRNVYNIEYRGNPEIEEYDTIMLQTTYSDSAKLNVIESTITFDNGLKGTMKLRGNLTQN